MTEQTPPTSTAGHSHVDALKPGERLAEFEIVELLGVGGFGMVYKAFDHSLHRSVAIKEYMPSALVGRMQGQALSIRSSADQSTYQAGLVSFVEEARLLAQFDHPSLVKVFRFWEANNTAYMVMPLYSGMTFKQARAQMRTPPPELWLRQVLWSVLSALRVLHDAKMLHRDISPDNIFLQYSGPPVLLDLGAARHAINDQHQRNTAVLKVNYAPIEQYAEGDDQLPQGPWSDIYSLAAVIHGCLCNDTPLPATLRAIRDRMVPLPRVAKTIKTQFGVRYSTPFITALQQSLAIRPEDRPQSIDALLQTMEMMTPPAGIQQFDFRSDLGHVWVEPADQPVPGLEPTTVDVATAARILADAKVEHARASEPISDQAAIDGHKQSNATDNPDTVFVEYGASDSELETIVASQHKEERRRKSRGTAADSKRHKLSALWLMLAGLVVAVVVAGVAWRQAPTASLAQKQKTEEVILTELAEPAPVPLVQTSPPVEELPSLASTTVDGNNVELADINTQSKEVAPAFVDTANARKPVEIRANQRRKSDAKVELELLPKAPEVIYSTQVIEPLPPASAPQPRPPPKPANPNEACAKESFFGKPMCVYQECQKSSMSSHPVCVESKRRLEAEEQRRRQSLAF